MTFVQATTGQGGWPLNVFLTPDLQAVLRRHLFPAGQPLWPAGLPAGAAAGPAALADAPRRRGQFGRRHPCAPAAIGRQQRPLCPALVADRRGPAQRGRAPQESYDAAQRRVRRRAQVPAAQPAAVPAALRPALPRRGGRRAWCCTPATAWPPAAFTTSSAAALPATRWMPSGWCRISRRCSMTTRSWRSCISMPTWSAAKRATPTSRATSSTYVLRDMTHPDGGFYSAEDADSEGHEGKFYCWTRAELAKLLTPRGVQGGGPLLRHHRAGQLRGPQPSRSRCRTRTC